MKLCDKCHINPVKVSDSSGGDVCWKCYYISLLGKEKGLTYYYAVYGKDGVQDEK